MAHEVLRWLRAAAPRSAHLQGSESSGEVRNRRPETSGSESSAFLQESLEVCYISPVSHRQFASPRLPLYCCAVLGWGLGFLRPALASARVSAALAVVSPFLGWFLPAWLRLITCNRKALRKLRKESRPCSAQDGDATHAAPVPGYGTPYHRP